MFRRPRFQPIRRNILLDIPPVLRQAYRLMSSGNYEEAAVQFERLAQAAQASGLGHEVNLFLTAGQCRLMSDEIDQAMCNFNQGLGILASREKGVRLQRACQRCIRVLTEKGYSKEAQEIFNWQKSVLPLAVEPAAENGKSHGTLPSVCPSCGGNIRSDEVEWIDEHSAECVWCGSTIKIEKE
jgi:hypothetical protein